MLLSAAPHYDRRQAAAVRGDQKRITQARVAAAALGDQVYTKVPFVSGMKPVTGDLVELVLNRTWRPQLPTIGMEGLPTPDNGGNVLRLYTRARLTLRLPPTVDAETAEAAVKKLLVSNPPHGAEVEFEGGRAATGRTPRRSPPGSSAPWPARRPPSAGRRPIWAKAVVADAAIDLPAGAEACQSWSVLAGAAIAAKLVNASLAGWLRSTPAPNQDAQGVVILAYRYSTEEL
jgi:hypothetical protein